MALLRTMPPITIDQAELAAFGAQWTANGEKLSRTPPRSSGQLGQLFDQAVGEALAEMLGGIPMEPPGGGRLLPPSPDCVEVGSALVIGGIRPQQFDVTYRPDGVRFAFDSKTLNDEKSIGKNWQNMINDLATEATTVHSRFPYAVVAFMVILPNPAARPAQRANIIQTLERLGRRVGVEEPAYMAEAVGLVFWEPADGSIDPAVPDPDSPVRIENFSSLVDAAYHSRYKGLPPHAE